MRFRFSRAAAVLLAGLQACLPPRLVIKEHLEPDEVWEVAIFPFGDAPGAAGSGGSVAELFATELLKLPQYNLIEKGIVESRLQARGLAGRKLNMDEALSVGDELGADAILLGEVTAFRKRHLWLVPPAEASLNVRLVEVKTGHVIWSAYHRRNYGIAHWVTTFLPFPPTMALSLLYSPSVESRAEQSVQNVVSALNKAMTRHEKTRASSPPKPE